MLKIGPYELKSRFLLAPMAGVSEMPYRCIALEYGAGLATTELISSKGIFYQNERTSHYLKYNPKIENPYSLQLFGGDEEAMCKAAVKAAEKNAKIIDINMGCPVKKVTKTGAGSALLSDINRAASLVKNMIKALKSKNYDIPVTVKIRTGWDADHINCVDMTQAMEDVGCAALAMHGRTRAQGYSGTADWKQIKAIKLAAKKMPIIGNGDIFSWQDAYRMQEETGCDGMMIGRGALGNPWIFQACVEKQDIDPSPKERCKLLLRHLNEHIDFHYELTKDIPSRNVDPETRAIRAFRTHLVWYSKGVQNGKVFREKIMQMDDRQDITKIITDFFLNQESTANLKKQKNITYKADDSDDINYKQAFG